MSEQTVTVTGEARVTAPNIYPCLGYRDAKAAIRWLCDAFGFEERMVHPGEDREVAHAELSLGPGIVMLGSASDDMPEVATELFYCGRRGRLLPHPVRSVREIDDVDAHRERAPATPARRSFASRRTTPTTASSTPAATRGQRLELRQLRPTVRAARAWTSMWTKQLQRRAQGRMR